MADMEQTGALPTTEDGAVANYGTKGNVSVGGQKGVSLEGAQSADIRERLMQMIAARERGNPMEEAMGHLALTTSEQSGFAKNYNDYLARKRQQEQDLLGMHVSMGQLASEEARLKREAQLQQGIMNMFGGAPQAAAPSAPAPATGGGLSVSGGAPSLGVSRQPGPGTEGQPAGGLSAVPPQTAFSPAQPTAQSMIQALPPEERGLFQMRLMDPKTRSEAFKQLQERIAPTTLERELQAAGLPQDDTRASILASRLGGAFTPNIKTYNPATGYENPQPTSQFDLARQRLGIGANTPAPAAAPAAGAPAPTAPTAGGAPGQMARPDYSLTPNAMSQFGDNPYPFGTEAWQKRNAELTQAQTGRLSKSLEEEDKAANAVLATTRQQRPADNQLLAKVESVMPNIRKFPGIFGSKRDPGFLSSLGRALQDRDQGIDKVITSLVETKKIPSKNLKEARETLEAVKGIFDYASAIEAKSLFGSGQGQTDKDLQTAKNIAGDPRRLNDKTVEAALKVMTSTIGFRQQMVDAYDNMRRGNSNMTFAEFQRSDLFKNAEKALHDSYADSLKVLTVEGATPAAKPPAFFNKPAASGETAMTPQALADLRAKTKARFGGGNQ